MYLIRNPRFNLTNEDRQRTCPIPKKSILFIDIICSGISWSFIYTYSQQQMKMVGHNNMII